MTPLEVGLILFALLLVLLIGGVWIAIALAAVAWFGLQFFTTTPPDVNLFQSFWGSSASWTLAALPLFVWMGEILFRTRLSEEMFEGLAPWLGWLPGRLMHVNIIGCGIFAAVSGSSAATCATIGKVALPELRKRGYDEKMSLGSLCGAGTLGLLIPPSIIMIVYAVAAEVSILKMFIAGVLPGIMLIGLFSGCIAVWALMHPEKTPAPTEALKLRERLHRARNLIPTVLLIVFTMSIVLPMVQAAGIDLMWFGIFIVILVEIAQVTPTVGFNLFVLQTMSGRDIYYVARASIPFFFMMMIALGIVIAYPSLSSW